MTVEEVQKAIDDLKAQGAEDEDILYAFYKLFQEDKINIEELGALCDVLGYELTDEFINMSPEEQKVNGFIEDEEDDEDEDEEIDEDKKDFITLEISFENIVEISTDAIINSLGVQTSKYGKVCKWILEISKSLEMKKTLDSLKKVKVGDVYVTDAGELSAKEVIHVVTPTKKSDDKENHLLIQAYKNAFSKALEEGVQSIGVPLLGTGANRYSKNDSYDACRTAIAELNEENIESTLKVKLLIWDEEYSLKNMSYIRESIQEDGDYGFFDDVLKIKNESVENAIKISKLMGILNEDNAYYPPTKHKYKYPFEFVSDWLYSHGKKESCLVKNCLLNKGVKMHIKKKVQMEKYEIYAIAVELGMTPAEVVQWMIMNGTCFNPRDKLDMFEVQYLLGEFGKLDKLDYGTLSIKECGLWVSLSNSNYWLELQDYYKKQKEA